MRPVILEATDARSSGYNVNNSSMKTYSTTHPRPKLSRAEHLCSPRHPRVSGTNSASRNKHDKATSHLPF